MRLIAMAAVRAMQDEIARLKEGRWLTDLDHLTYPAPRILINFAMTFDLSANLALKEREFQVPEMSLLELGPILFGDIEKLISYIMRGKGLLASTLTCSR